MTKKNILNWLLTAPFLLIAIVAVGHAAVYTVIVQPQVALTVALTVAAVAAFIIGFVRIMEI